MRIIVSNEITIEHPSQELKDWCKKTLVVKNPDFEKKFRMKLWLGDTPEKIWLYKVDGDSIILPFGVLTAILPMTEGANFETRFPKKRKIDYQCEVPLFDYQEPAVDALCEAKYGILQSKAGSGKTQMGIALIAKLGVKTLWLTHTQDLLRQSFERAAQYMDSSLFGTITAGKVHIGKGITFATVQTLAKQDSRRKIHRWRSSSAQRNSVPLRTGTHFAGGLDTRCGSVPLGEGRRPHRGISCMVSAYRLS